MSHYPITAALLNMQLRAMRWDAAADTLWLLVGQQMFEFEITGRRHHELKENENFVGLLLLAQSESVAHC